MSSDGGGYQEAADITSKIEELRDSYISSDGSNNTSMLELRNKFAKILPFNSKNWYRHWSEFAYELVKVDNAAKRPVYSNQGERPTTTPRSAEDRLYVFAPPTNPVYPPDLSRHTSPAAEITNTGIQNRGVSGSHPLSHRGDQSTDDREIVK
ncbi:hypothetical protein DFH28DRAFT_925901 [Melampsora americana]|nr:hypothetical protein DFH28DRAFT_925901 [Melampsora americana]